MGENSNFLANLQSYLTSLQNDEVQTQEPTTISNLKPKFKINKNIDPSKGYKVDFDENGYQGHNTLTQVSNLNIQDPSKILGFTHTEEAIENSLHNNLKEALINKLQEQTQQNDDILKLQNELFGSIDEEIYANMNLSYGNNLHTEYLFDALSGEVERIVSRNIVAGSKDVSLSTGHHQPGRPKKNKKVKKSNVERKIGFENEMMAKFEDQVDMFSKSSESGSLSYFESQEITENMRTIRNLHDMLNLTKGTMSDEGDQAKLSSNKLLNDFWNSLPQPTTNLEDLVQKDQFVNDSFLFDVQESNFGQENQTEIAKTGEAPVNGLPQEDQTKLEPSSSPKKPGAYGVPQYEWAIQDNLDLTNFYDLLPKSRFAIDYPFELDDFQKRAILHLERKESVFVAAHTSAGKTVVAEYAIALSKKHMTRAIYTSPIKALSNQKYRDFLNKFDSVGILTGDVTLKPEASCLIVTTEVLRSMLFKGSDTIRDIEWVIFDEVHYVNDIERGVVWEETIIMLPEHIGIIMLSATVPNAMDFANWVGRTKRRKIFVQTTYKRPTPLEHSIYFEGQFKVIKSKEGSFLQQEYEKFLKNLVKEQKAKDDLREKRHNDIIEKFDKNDWDFKDKQKKAHFQRKQLKSGQQEANSKQTSNKSKMSKETSLFHELIRHCSKENLLPCVFFAFSKKKCMELAYGLISLNLCSKEEISRITRFYDNAIKRLKPVDRELPQLIKLKELLVRGIAVHHGDLLPLAKEVVEILFADGLIKVLFATETFAMGVNMPAKTVVFCGLRKNDGKDFRYLKSNEYTQMSGRAGRRGLDDKGNVVLFVKNKGDLPPTYELKKIIDQKGELLESKFRLTYGTIFNLLLAKEINVIDIMQRSFSQHGKITSLPNLEKKLKSYNKQKELIEKNIKCIKDPSAKAVDIIQNYTDQLDMIKEDSGVIWSNLLRGSSLRLPCLASIVGENGEFETGIIFNMEKIDQQIIFQTLFIENTSKHPKGRKIEISYEENYKSNLKVQGEIINNVAFYIYNIDPSNIIQIYPDEIKVGNLSKELTHKQKELLVEALKKEKRKRKNEETKKL